MFIVSNQKEESISILWVNNPPLNKSGDRGLAKSLDIWPVLSSKGWF